MHADFNARAEHQKERILQRFETQSLPRRAGGFALATIAAWLMTACSPSPENLLDSAREFAAKGDRKGAMIQLRTVLQEDPQSGEARMLMAQVLFDSGDYVGAVVELDKAAKLLPAERVVPLRAVALVTRGDGPRALKDHGSVRLNNPQAQAELDAALGQAHAVEGRLEEAKRLTDKALDLNPSNTRARLFKARLMATENAFEDALALTDTVIKEDPRNPNGYLTRADVLLAGRKDSKGAEEAYRLGLQADPAFIPAHMQLIRMALADKDDAAARARVEALKKSAPNHPLAVMLEAQLAVADRRFDRARELSLQLLKIGSQDVRVQLLAARVENELGSLAQAETHAQKALQLAPDRVDIRRLIAQVQLRRGQSQQAMDTLKPITQGDKADATALALLAQAYLQEGKPGPAEALLQRAAKLAPNIKHLQALAATTKLGKGTDSAVMLELESLASQDEGVTADMALFAARLQRGEFRGALAAAENYQRKLPKAPLGLQLEAQAHLGMKEMGKARSALERATELDAAFLPAANVLAGLDLQDKKPELALTRFDKVLAKDPKNVQAHLAILELKSRLGANPEDLLVTARAAVRASPDASVLRIRLVSLMLATKDHKGAVIAAQEAVSALSDLPELLDVLGRAQLAAGDREQATNTFKRLVAQQPENVLFQMRLAEVYQTLGERDLAQRTLKKALELKPDFVTAQQGLVAASVEQRRFDEALTVARQVQKQRPKEAVGWEMEGDILVVNGESRDALASFRQALQKEQLTSSAVKLHAALVRDGKRTEADQFAAGWERDRPRDFVFNLYQGDVALARSNWAEAERRYRVLRELQPRNVVILNNLAYAMAKLQMKDALAVAQEAARLAPESPPILDTLALAHSMNKDHTKALEVQKQAVAKSKDDPSLRVNLARLYIAAGDRSSARKELEKVAAVDGDFSGKEEIPMLLRSL